MINPSEKKQIKLADNILNRIKENKKVLGMCGNGGSMAEAQHFAGELVPIGIPAMAFNDLSIITAIANDFHYSKIFTVQIDAFRNILDTVFLFTTSGKSENILNSLSYLNAITQHIHKIGITSDKTDIKFASGIKEYFIECNDCTLIQFKGDTAKVQEKTLEFIHIFYKRAQEIWDI